MRIRNWDRFQHYKAGTNSLRVTWIKVYVELLDDREWCALSGDAARFLLMLWLMSADHNGEVGTSDDIAWRLRMKKAEVERLLREVAGWIEDHDSVLPIQDEGDLPIAKRREEKEEREDPVDLDAFDEVWSTHRRGSKAKALAEYRKAVPQKLSHESLLEALVAYVASFRDDFAGAHLERWIRDERWEEYDPDSLPAGDEPRTAEAARWV